MIRVVGKPKLPEVLWDAPPLSDGDRTAVLELFTTHRRNFDWYQAHAESLIEQFAGQFVCVAGGETFVASTAQEAFRLANAAHPEEANAIFGIRIRDNGRSEP